MKPLLFALTLLLAAATFAQSPGYPQQSSPPQQTMPNRSLPPDQTQQEQEEMGQSQAVPPAQVEQEIQQAFEAQAALSNTNLRAANLSTVTVKGTVANENQHQMALRVAVLHANGLRVVDRIKVQQ